MALVFYKQAVKKLLLLDICKYFIIYTFSRPMSFIIRAGSRASWLQRVVLVKVCFKSPIFDLVVGGHNSVILDRRSHRRCSVKKKCSQKFCKILRKTPVPESLFNKVAGPLAQLFSCEFYEISKNIFFTEDLRTTAFDQSAKIPKIVK